MGVLAVFVQERLMRGNSYSTRWIRPANTIVWAQAPKDGRGRAAWWPAFVLASNSKLFPMQPRMSAINIKRLELDIRRALHKLRPRSNVHNGATAAAAAAASSLATSSPLTIDGATPSSSAPHSPAAPPEKVLSAKALSALANAFTKDSELVCPEGYLLVEFFGSHDFGWVKADICSPFTVEQREGATPTHSLPVLSPAAQGRTVIYCAEGVIKQAIAAALYLADTIMHCGEAVEVFTWLFIIFYTYLNSFHSSGGSGYSPAVSVRARRQSHLNPGFENRLPRSAQRNASQSVL
jgi:hypothetical protein